MNKLLYFLAGAAVGSLVTWKVITSRYEVIEDEPETTEPNQEEHKEDNTEEPKTDSTDDLKKCNDIIKENGYVSYSNPNADPDDDSINEGHFDMVNGDIRILTPDEFAEDQAYETETWFIYEDGVVTDSYHNVIEDPKAYIGDAKDHFGEYEEDSVFIRNDGTMTDYELLRDGRTWTKAMEDFKRTGIDSWEV